MQLMKEKILNQIDEKFNTLFFDENLIKESKKLPNKIKISLEKGKKVENNWDDNNLTSNIHDCIFIEKNINDIQIKNKHVNKCSSINLNFKFFPNDEQIKADVEKIKNFGILFEGNFKFKKSKMSNNEKYEILGDFKNIIIKKGKTRNGLGFLMIIH